MKERPIIFTGEMVRAILDGSKIQTRRVIKPQPELGKTWKFWTIDSEIMDLPKSFCPYGVIGDRLWVRETFCWISLAENEYYLKNPNHRRHPDGYPVSVIYKADADREGFRPDCYWKPSIHIPRWASRINLEIIGCRTERLQEINYLDAVKEGIPNGAYAFDPVYSFQRLWDSINTKRGYSWNTNPWVWVIEFKRLDRSSEVAK